MHEFILEFGIALIYVGIPNVIYSNTNIDNINAELTKIYLRDLLSLYVGVYQRCTIEEHLLNEEHNKTLSKLKELLLTTLFDGFETIISSWGTREELETYDLKDILILLDDICSQETIPI